MQGTINGYKGPLQIFQALIVEVVEKDGHCDIHLGADGESGPWLSVYPNEIGKAYPPKVGDLVTIIVPKVIKLQRK